jgi:hypothetical protein
MREAAALFGLGMFAGAYGTMIGAGGGFLIVPALLMLFHFPVLAAVGTSLCTVFVNATSGTVNYMHQKRVEYRTGLAFVAAVVPGALAGAVVARWWHPGTFTAVFGVLLIILSAFILLRHGGSTAVGSVPEPVSGPGLSDRTLVDATGVRFRYAVNMRLGMAVSVVAGLLSSLLGIGGGIIHVPVMIYWLGIPAHVAIATSHFILALSSLTGVVVFALEGGIRWPAAACLGAGAAIGAQVGARLASRLHARWLARFLGVALFLLGIRLLVAVLP